MLAKIYIGIGVALIFIASAAINIYQSGRINTLTLKLAQASETNDGNQTAIESLQAAQSECLAKIERDEERRTAALTARDDAYADLALKYDRAKASLARVLEDECRDWANEPVCVANILGE